MRKRARTALVMEGYTDCIVAHQYGFDNAVAVLGTALGERHVHGLEAVRRPDRAGPRRRRGRAAADQRGAGAVRQPERRPADRHAAGGARPVRFPPPARGRGVPRAARGQRGRTPWNTPSGRSRGASTWTGTSMRPARRWSGWWRSWPRPRASRPDTTPGGPFPRGEDLAAAGGQFPRAEGDVRERLTALRRSAKRRAGPAPRARGPRRKHGLRRRPAGTQGRPSPGSGNSWNSCLHHPNACRRPGRRSRPEAFAPGPGREIYEDLCRLADAGVAADVRAADVGVRRAGDPKPAGRAGRNRGRQEDSRTPRPFWRN